MLTWQEHRSWVAVFDVLGFKERSRQTDHAFPRMLLQGAWDDLLECLEKQIRDLPGAKYQVVSDTVVLFAPDATPQSWVFFAHACKMFLRDSIRLRFPLQGAMSCGYTLSAVEQPIITGPAVVEAYEHCEAQNWIGLLSCGSATRAIRAAGVDPLHNDFVDAPIPWRHRQAPASFVAGEALAYRFQNGMANFPSTLLPWLAEMRQLAPEGAREKYANTMEFIEERYQYLP